jgi:hypothetical protein
MRNSAPGTALHNSVPGEYWMAEDFDAPLDDFKDYAEKMKLITADENIGRYDVPLIW